MKYSINQIFEDSMVNSTLDRFYYELQQATELVAESHLFLSGRAAAIMQGEVLDPCKNVVLITANAVVYAAIQNVLPLKINHKGVVKFKERTLYEFEAFKLEVWWSDDALAGVQVDSIWQQTLATINEILL